MFINKVIKETGCSPSFEEMKAAVGLKSKSGIHALIEALEEREFIRKLPHHLIQAFRSTLEEARYADYILHVVDTSNPQMELQMQVVYDTLRELKVEDKKIVTLLNKQDKLFDPVVVKDFRADASLAVSAKTGQGLEDLKNLLSSWMMEGKIYIERLYPYDKAGTISLIRGYGILLEEEYLPEGIRVKAYVPKDIYPRV